MDLARRRGRLGRGLGERLRPGGGSADEHALGRRLGHPVLRVEDIDEPRRVESRAEHPGDALGVGGRHETGRQHDEIGPEHPLHAGAHVLDLHDGPVVGVELDPGRGAPQELDTGRPCRRVPALALATEGAQLEVADRHPRRREEPPQPDGVLQGDRAAESRAVRQAAQVA